MIVTNRNKTIRIEMADMEEYHNIINFGAGPAKIPREVSKE